MVILVLAALLQGFDAPSQATPADSAFVRGMLDSATAAVHIIKPQSDLASLLIEQVGIWRGEEAEWQVARAVDDRGLAVDTMIAPPRPPPTRHYQTTRFLLRLMHSPKQEKLRQYLMALPPLERATIVTALSDFTAIPHEVVPLLDSLTTNAAIRGHRMFRQAVGLRSNRNPTAARDTLHRAIEVLRSSGVEHYPLEWAIELMMLGEPVPVAKLIELGVREAPNTRGAPAEVAQIRGIHYVAGRLYNLDAQRLSSIADTLLNHLPPDTSGIIAMLLEKRGAPGDSAAAIKIRSVLRARHPMRTVGGSAVDYTIYRDLGQAVRERDPDALNRALIRWRTNGSAGPLASAARSVPTHERHGGDPVMPKAERDEALAVIDRLWLESAVLDPVGRDRVRFELIKVLARLDAMAALDSTRNGLSTQPARDRARAEALRHLVSVDPPLVEREAQSLKDPYARDATYRALTMTAVASGRLADARRFADTISRGSTASIRSQFAVARALVNAGAAAEPIQRLRKILPYVNSIPACSGCALEVVDDSIDRADIGAPEELGYYRQEIINIVSLALELDMHPDLSAWAASRVSAGARVWAWLEISQAVAFVKLGRFPNIPIHGQ